MVRLQKVFLRRGDARHHWHHIVCRQSWSSLPWGQIQHPLCPMGGNGLPPLPAASSSAGSREQLPRRGSHTWNLWVRAPCASASGCHVLAAIVPLTCSKGFSAGRGIVALFLSTCECDSRTTTSSPRERCQESSCSKAYVYMAWKQPISFLAL